MGCCGFPTARARYYAHFSAVEVQTTFYEPPREATARQWRQSAPDAFEFTLKAWQLITHEPASPTYRRLRTALTESQKKAVGSFRLTPVTLMAWQRTLAIARALRADKVLFQCPASFPPTAENLHRMRRFFAAIDRDGLMLLWEPRGPRWSDDCVRQICEECGLVHCVDPFVRCCVTTGLRYYRLHGIGGYTYRFSDEDLARLRRLLPQDGDCYVMFNNTWMFDDALRFRRLLEN